MQLINKVLEEMRIVTSIINDEIKCQILLVYIKTEDGWYKISVMDGISRITYQSDEPKNSSWKHERDSFEFIMHSYEKIDLKKLGRVTKIQEYLYKGHQDESGGLLLAFESGEKIGIKELGDCLSVYLINGTEVSKPWILSDYIDNPSPNPNIV